MEKSIPPVAITNVTPSDKKTQEVHIVQSRLDTVNSRKLVSKNYFKNQEHKNQNTDKKYSVQSELLNDWILF